MSIVYEPSPTESHREFDFSDFDFDVLDAENRLGEVIFRTEIDFEPKPLPTSSLDDCESSKVGFCGSEYNGSDFYMDVLGDLELFDEISDMFEPPSAVTVDDNCEVTPKTTKRKGDVRKIHKHSSQPHLKLKSLIVPKLNSQYQAAVHASSTIVTTPQITAMFQNRSLRVAAPRPQSSLPDSVFYFPHAMINCLNSGDNLGLQNLMRTHMDEQCSLGIYCFKSMLSPKDFCKFFELLNMVHPDRILSLNNTKIVNNQVTSSAMMKFTDCKVSFDYVKQTVNEPTLMSMFNTRATHLKGRLYNSEKPEEERQQMLHLVESELDLVVYGILQFHLTFDETTNKATSLYLSGGLTSAHTARVNIDL